VGSRGSDHPGLTADLKGWQMSDKMSPMQPDKQSAERCVVVEAPSRHVAVVRINRPAAHNALNRAVLTDLRAALDSVTNKPAVRTVIITGTGEKAFSAGADVAELAGLDGEAAAAVLQFGGEVLQAFASAELPVIAAVNGLALGGGFELVLCATFSILAERAELGLPESALGLMPGYGGTQRLPRLVGDAVAAHIMLTGARLRAERAYQLGLTPVAPVPAGELLSAALEMAERIAVRGPAATRTILRAMRAGREGSLSAGLHLETELAARAVAGRDGQEGIAAFLERRAPSFAADER
jgi:enoyl-CoA hydratase